MKCDSNMKRLECRRPACIGFARSLVHKVCQRVHLLGSELTRQAHYRICDYNQRMMGNIMLMATWCPWDSKRVGV